MQIVKKMLLTVFVARGSKLVSSGFQRKDSSFTCDKVVDLGNSELENLSSFIFGYAVSFYKLMLVLLCVQTLASLMGIPGRELGVVFGFKV